MIYLEVGRNFLIIVTIFSSSSFSSFLFNFHCLQQLSSDTFCNWKTAIKIFCLRHHFPAMLHIHWNFHQIPKLSHHHHHVVYHVHKDILNLSVRNTFHAYLHHNVHQQVLSLLHFCIVQKCNINNSCIFVHRSQLLSLSTRHNNLHISDDYMQWLKKKMWCVIKRKEHVLIWYVLLW